MNRKICLRVLLCFVGCWLGKAVRAEEPRATIDANSFHYSLLDRQGRWQIGGSIGATIDPDLFLLTFEPSFYITHNFSIGPLLQIAVDDDLVMFVPTGQARFVFDIDHPSPLKRLKPFLQGGVGGVIGHASEPRSDTDIGFLANVGAGIDFYLNNRLALTNNLMVNIISTAINGHVFVSWQLLGIRYLF